MKKDRPLFSVRVRVPATTANLGPGFDALGLALDLYNEVSLTGWKAPGFPALTASVRGEGAEKLPLDKSNLVYRAVLRTFAFAGKKPPALTLRLVNRIPLSRGLGSSSAAIVGGIAAANAAMKHPLSFHDMVDLAAGMEGHPDNVTPALAGGLCVSVMAGKTVRFVSLKDPGLFKGLSAVVCVPHFELSTEKARRALPKQVSRADAVFNASRVALLLGAWQSGRFDLLGEAMDDRLHQPYRAKLVPGLMDVIAAAKKAGAHGAALSGAGPTVLALSPPSAADRVGRAMAAAFVRRGIRSHSLSLKPVTTGVRA